MRLRLSIRSYCFIGLTSAFGIVACADPPVEPSADSSAFQVHLQDDLVRDGHLIGIEAHFKEISDAVPEFAGYHFNARGELVIQVTDLAKGSAVRPFTDEIAARRGGSGPPAATTYSLATYPFSDLRDWRDVAAAYALARDDVRYVDLDEQRNRVTVGVTNAAAVTDWADLVAAAGVPANAITVVEASGFTTDTDRDESGVGERRLRTHESLRDRADTVRGGLQAKHNSNPACTLWIGATSSGDSLHLTASHCGDFATLESTATLHQKLSSAQDEIGEELDDPSSTCTVPAWADQNAGSEDCRWADAALYSATNLSRFSKGWVAETNSDAGGVDLVHGGMLVMSGEVAYPAVNDTVQLVGQKSGWWADADVTRTCVMMFQWPPPDGDYTLRCQDWAAYPHDTGDSGGPVIVEGGGAYEIIGAHIGGIIDEDTSFFSSIDGLEGDLGSLNTLGTPILENRVSPHGERLEGN